MSPFGPFVTCSVLAEASAFEAKPDLQRQGRNGAVDPIWTWAAALGVSRRRRNGEICGPGNLENPLGIG
jgi:hypothetical protein